MNENKDKIINGKALYTPKGAALEYGRIGCNFYTGCPHDCAYCYLKRGAPSKQLGGTEVRLKKCFKDEKHALQVFCKEVMQHRDQLKRTGVFFSFTTDPMIPDTIELTMQALLFLQDMGIPSYVLTKNADFIDYELFHTYMTGLNVRDLLHFGFTLTGRDDMEPNASSNYDRIVAIKLMHQWGFSTFASIEPVIDWQSSERVVIDSLPYCDHYKLGLRSGVKRDYYDIAESSDAILRIMGRVMAHGKTIYLKESIRKMLQQHLETPEYEQLLSLTVNMDGTIYNQTKEE